MRIIIWNVAKRRTSWQFLDEIEADVALLQEAIPPKGPAMAHQIPAGSP